MKDLFIFRHKEFFGRQAIYAWLILNISIIFYVLLALLLSRYLKTQESIVIFSFLFILPFVVLTYVYGYKNNYQIFQQRIRNPLSSTESFDAQKDKFDTDGTEKNLDVQPRQTLSNSNLADHPGNIRFGGNRVVNGAVVSTTVGGTSVNANVILTTSGCVVRLAFTLVLIVVMSIFVLGVLAGIVLSGGF